MYKVKIVKSSNLDLDKWVREKDDVVFALLYTGKLYVILLNKSISVEEVREFFTEHKIRFYQTSEYVLEGYLSCCFDELKNIVTKWNSTVAAM